MDSAIARRTRGGRSAVGHAHPTRAHSAAGQLIGHKAARSMRAIAERLLRRLATAAQRHGRLIRGKHIFVAFVVDDPHRSLDHQGAIDAAANRDLAHTDTPPRCPPPVMKIDSTVSLAHRPNQSSHRKQYKLAPTSVGRVAMVLPTDSNRWVY